MSTLTLILVAVLGFVTVAGLGFAFVGADGGQAKTAKRIAAVAGPGAKEKRSGRVSQADAATARRKQVLDGLKASERQQRKSRLAMDSRLRQAGMPNVTARQFWMLCGGLAVVAVLMALLFGLNPLVALGLGFGVGLGLPRWVLGVLIKGRHKKFTEEFPNAIDIIVRGIKSGLPVHDCLKVIARESPAPVDGEFQRLVEGLGLGMSLDQGLERMFDSMPTAEVRFFAIVMAIQQKTGGNLAEALSGLSTVLRARKLMREKIKAMSGEAVASAFIIGSLPPGIMGLVSLTSPSYMWPMYNDHRGQFMLLGGAVWMACGIFVMRRMINFKI
jgi:tight adherence protein B